MHSSTIRTIILCFILATTTISSAPVSDSNENTNEFDEELDILRNDLLDGTISKILELANGSDQSNINNNDKRQFPGHRWVDAPYFLKRNIDTPYFIKKDLTTPYFMKKGISTPYFLKRDAPSQLLKKDVSTPYFIKRDGVSTPYFMKKSISTPYFMKKSVSTPYFLKRSMTQDFFEAIIEKMIADQNYDPFKALEEQDLSRFYKDIANEE